MLRSRVLWRRPSRLFSSEGDGGIVNTNASCYQACYAIEVFFGGRLVTEHIFQLGGTNGDIMETKSAGLEV